MHLVYVLLLFLYLTRGQNFPDLSALTELQQQRLQVCENNWVRKIARVTRADRRRMVELKGSNGSAEKPDRETGQEQITVGWTRGKDGG